MASDKHMEKAREIGSRWWCSHCRCRPGNECEPVKEVAAALANAEREGREDERKRFLGIARRRQEKCLDEIAAAGSDAYWQGAASSACIIATSINEPDPSHSSALSSRRDEQTGEDARFASPVPPTGEA